MKYYFQDHIAGILLRAIAVGIVRTVYGFFNGSGGVYYSPEFPPVWVQLLCNFLIVVIIWTAGELILCLIVYSIKRKRGKI